LKTYHSREFRSAPITFELKMESDRKGDSDIRIPSLMSTIRAILREGGIPLSILVVLTLALKLLFQFDYQAHNPLAQFPISDELLYIHTAEEIAGGKLAPDHSFHSAPLYPYLAAPIFAVCGPDPMAVRLFQALLGTGSVLLLYLITRFFFTRPWALCAAGAMALYYPFTFFEGKVLIVTSAVFFLNLGTFFLVALTKVPRAAPALLAGIALGTASALRPNLILIAPAALLWLLFAMEGRRKWVLGLPLLLGFALPIAPFTMHNYVEEKDFVLLSDNGGINFYFGNNPSARGSFQVDDPKWGHIEHQFYTAREIAEAETGRSLKPSEVSRFWFDKGFAFITSQPLDYLFLLYQKFKSFLENFEYAIIYTPPSERDLTVSLYLPFLPYAVFVAGTAAGLISLAIRRRRFRSGTREDRQEKGDAVLPAPWMLVVMILGVNILSILLFFNYSRFRLVALPSMILLSLLAAEQLIRCGRARQGSRCFFTLLAAAVGLACSLVMDPFQEQGMEQWKLQKAHGFATVGTAFGLAGQFEDGERYYTRALEIKSDMDLILSKRGRLRMEAEDFQGAKEDLEEAIRINPHYSMHHAVLAEFLSRETPHRDLDQALESIQQALQLPTSAPSTLSYIHMTEGNVRMERREYDLAVGAYQSAYVLAPYMHDLLFLQGLAHEGAGDMEKARELFERCLEAEPGHRDAREALRR
jgi:4-amino-4-deoxy-L-arabinose transferase-like glycosyltransferase/Tfp pilus assembly protein PilF